MILNTNKQSNNLNDIIKKRKENNKNKKIEETNKKPTMADVLAQLKSGQIKLKKTDIINKPTKDKLMTEMEKILKRRISLIDGQ